MLRSTSPMLDGDSSQLSSDNAGSSYTDSGAASSPDYLYFYVVSDTASKPSIQITDPCTSPCSTSTTARLVAPSGTVIGANAIYVNDIQGSIGAGTFTSGNVPLFLGPNSVVAAAKNSTGDWAIAKITITRTNGNMAPTISIAAPTTDGATIYTATPLITITYSDPENLLSTNSFNVYINGTEDHTLFTIGSNSATYQVSAEQPLSNGLNFIYATSRHFVPLSPRVR